MNTAQEFSARLDSFGRRCSAILMLLSACIIPTVFGLSHHALPTFQQFAASAGPLILITAPTAISEILAYTPVLGSGSYLAFCTGNILTMRITSQMNAVSLSEAETNTEAYDLISTYAVAISVAVSIATMLAVAALASPLSPVLSSPTVSTASKYILPALYGSMVYSSLFSKGKKDAVTGKWKIFSVPFALVMAFIFITGPLGQRLGFVMLVCLPITLLTAYVFYKLGWVRLEKH